MVLGSVGSGRRMTTSSTLHQCFRSRSAWVRRQHSPLSLLCITMILRVRRKILKLLRSPTEGVAKSKVRLPSLPSTIYRG